LAERLTSLHRDALQACLLSRGIGCARYFAPIHLQPSYAAWKDVDLPVTESQADHTLALPFFNNLSQLQIEEVAETLRQGLRALA
jgi:perosamine synthetase